jgi:fucose permease
MQPTFRRDRFTWLAYLLLAFYGYYLNILGPITPFLKDELGLSYTVSSLHFTAFAVGMLLVGLGGHLVIQHLGRGRSLWIGAFGLSLGALLLMAGKNPFFTISASFLMGVIGSLILVIIPSTLSDQHGELRAVAFSESNVIASLVATAAPLLVGWCVHFAGGWRLALGMAAVLPILMRLGFGKVQLPRAAAAETDPVLVKEPLPFQFWVYWAAIVLAVSAEFCMISWSADYLEKGLGMLKADAAQALSLFLAAMLIGRFTGSRLVQRFSPHRLVNLSVLVAGGGFLLFWLAGSAPLAMSGLFITGLGIASLYPLTLSLAMGAAGDKTVQASARAALASGTAILALPLILGRLADGIGIWGAYGVVIFLLLGVFLITRFARSTEPLRLVTAE